MPSIFNEWHKYFKLSSFIGFRMYANICSLPFGCVSLVFFLALGKTM